MPLSEATLKTRMLSMLQMRARLNAPMEYDVPETLARFLSWLLDARWFPERDVDEKGRVKAELLAVRRIVRRMEAFARNRRDVRLQRGLADWKSYEETMVQLAKTNVRRSPYMKISAAGRGETEIAERLLCATLIIRRLWPEVSAYAKMQELLAEPARLPHLATAAEDSAKGLKTYMATSYTPR